MNSETPAAYEVYIGLERTILWVPETRSGYSVNLSGLGSGSLVGERARRSWRIRDRVGRSRGGSGRLAVFVDEPVTGGVSSDRLAGPVLHDAVVAGRASPEAAVGSMPVVVLDVLA